MGAGGCNAGETLCGVLCVLTMTDALNCGTCGERLLAWREVPQQASAVVP
jgi:hypothetical protein